MALLVEGLGVGGDTSIEEYMIGPANELGEEEEKLHYEVGRYTKGKVDFLICVGNLARNIYEGAIEEKEEGMTVLYLKEKEEIYSQLKQIIMPQDTILLKASHGMGFADIVSWFERNYLKQEIDF
jgi:UDP-N-acetylmuramoyl-tripeptide--D-alanyl-D-alanine ligase